MPDTLLAFIDEKQLWGPLVQLLGAFVAFGAVIWTQLKLTDRSERDIVARFQQMKEQHKHDEKIKAQELKLKKIEEIYENVQAARKIYISLNSDLFELQCQNKHSETLETVKNAITDAHHLRLKVELLSKIYLYNRNLCSNWSVQEKGFFPEDVHNMLPKMRTDVLISNAGAVLGQLNNILNELADYAQQDG